MTDCATLQVWKKYKETLSGGKNLNPQINHSLIFLLNRENKYKIVLLLPAPAKSRGDKQGLGAGSLLSGVHFCMACLPIHYPRGSCLSLLILPTDSTVRGSYFTQQIVKDEML